MSENVTLTIDGTEVTVPKGTSIIQAAKQIGAEIPHFCWHPGLSVAGVCRFCMVKVENMPKLQISCNTMCAEGMKVYIDEEEVKNAHKWALEFHLINHPLDCPICDQAGECELQNSYMKYGKYVSQMAEDKVLKPKALDVGDNLVLDTERCILCSRCVRFENEVTKTNALGIFNRGDHSIIGTYPGRRINHNYSYNVADICPVGAFTAKDFRFECRVWFLTPHKSVCPGCSTGCNVDVFYNKRQRKYYRLKPRQNDQVNGHWMCDYGRTMYMHLNSAMRFMNPIFNGHESSWNRLHKELEKSLQDAKNQKSKVQLILTPQYTNEEYESIFSCLDEYVGIQNVSVLLWRNRNEKIEDFDGLLMRGDKNSNTKGLNYSLEKWNVKAKSFHTEKFAEFSKSDTLTLIFAPEIQLSYDNFDEDIALLASLQSAFIFTVNGINDAKKFTFKVPVRAFTEKTGSFTNFDGIVQKLESNTPVYYEQKSVDEIFNALKPKQD